MRRFTRSPGAALRSARQKFERKGTAGAGEPRESIVGRAGKRQRSKAELLVRPATRTQVEPLLKRAILKIKSAAIADYVRQTMLDNANSYHAFYVNWRGDVLCVRKKGINSVGIYVDLLKPGELPEHYGNAGIEVKKAGVEMVLGGDFQLRLHHGAGTGEIKITSANRVGKDVGGSEAWGLFRIVLNEALKLRKKGQAITITALNKKLKKHYRRYGFRFIDPASGAGVLSAKKIERGFA